MEGNMMKTFKRLPGDRLRTGNTHTSLVTPATGVTTYMTGVLAWSRAFGAPQVSSRTGEVHRRGSDVSTPREAAAVSIYAVDSEDGLTDLYVHFLKGTGYSVRAFNQRAEALAAMAEDEHGPDLLIMDYLGDSMPVDDFLQRCRLLHPAVRILMASGFGEDDVQFSGTRPDRFLQKPFTAEEFLREVGRTLAV